MSVKGSLDEKPRRNPFGDNLPGEGWYKALLKRHLQQCERVHEAVTPASARVSETT